MFSLWSEATGTCGSFEMKLGGSEARSGSDPTDFSLFFSSSGGSSWASPCCLRPSSAATTHQLWGALFVDSSRIWLLSKVKYNFSVPPGCRRRRLRPPGWSSCTWLAPAPCWSPCWEPTEPTGSTKCLWLWCVHTQPQTSVTWHQVPGRGKCFCVAR